jgi:hypothetical protein
MSDNRWFVLVLILLFSQALTWSNAHASLGGSIDSIESDRKALSGRLSKIAPTGVSERFTVHEIAQGSSTIREYALPDGTVFAVTWRGMTQPDLSVLFGSYFNDYQNALASMNQAGVLGTPETRHIQRRGRAARVVRGQNIVVERSGHMRDVRGKAYVPRLMPRDVLPEDLTE